MKLTLLSIFLFASTVSLHAQKNQLLVNPDFDDGTNGWWYSGAAVTANNGEVFFDITSAGTNPWDVQLGQGDLTLRQGYKYTLSWRAKRESGAMEFRVALGSEPYTTYIHDKREGFDGNWQESSVEYIHNDTNIADIGVTLQMGGNDANATIDYINLTEEPFSEEDKVKITFQVDLQNQIISEEGVFLNGSFNDWENPVKMQSNGTTYSAELELVKGSTVKYKYLNGNEYESITGNCIVGDNTNRTLTVPYSDSLLDKVCFNSCYLCPDSTIINTNPGVGPVSYYGKMQVQNNRIIGERTQQPMQVKGISFFWSIWGGQNFWTPGAVNALVDDWKVELIRAPMSVEMDDQWGSDKGYLNPEGKQSQINYVETLVEAAIERDIYIIIDFHSHEAHMHTQEAKEFFGYMANKYGNFDNVVFEIYNEPIEPDWPTIKAYAEAVIDTIRIHSDNLVVVGTEFYSQRVDNASRSPIDDINTAYVFHFYANHQEDLRNIVRTALDNNVALFASEWGNIHIGGDKDGTANEESFANSDAWHELMDEKMISSANWSVFADGKPNSANLHSLSMSELSKTGEQWNDTTIMTPSGKYVFNMLKEHAQQVPWRKAEHTSTVEVTFNVNLYDENIPSEGVFIAGSFNNWESQVEMTANNTLFSATIELPIGDYVEYRFKKGSSQENGEDAECFTWDKNRLLVVPESNISLETVCFNSCEECASIETFVIDAFSYPASGGAISGTGTYEYGKSVTLTAIPNEGYEFINWTNNGNEISGDSIFTVSVSESLNLQANFNLVTGADYFNSFSSNISVFPNPADNIITVNGLPANDNVSLKIYNSHSQLILEKSSVNESEKQIELENLKPGIYYLLVKGATFVKEVKIVKAQ